LIVQVQQEGPLCRLTLNRPDRGNALGPAMVDALDAALTQAMQAGTRLLVLQGAGRNFCTGFDLAGLEQLTDAILLDRFIRVELILQRFHTAPFTTMAIARGRAYGAGADLFAACDRRIAEHAAVFAFPGSAFGLVLGTERLATRIGETAARTILLDGHEIPATKALALGLASTAVEASEIEPLISAATTAATRLEPVTVAELHTATRSGNGDAALAALVRSAARPGLHARITAYREASKRA
jgi:enoyl-CoA hydratase